MSSAERIVGVGAPPRIDPITASEVGRWLGNAKKPLIDDQRCGEVAARLNRMRWAKDPEPEPDKSSVTIVQEKDDRLWDFPGSKKAAKQLLAALPKMIAFHADVATPDREAKLADFCALAEIMQRRMQDIEHPFGLAENMPRLFPDIEKTMQRLMPDIVVSFAPRKPHRKGPHHVIWHTPALVVWRFLRDASLSAGADRPKAHKSSPFVKAVRLALIRMGYLKEHSATTDTIRKSLQDWHDRFGEII